MSLLLAGITVLMIGDSHMSSENYLITTLHDGLMGHGAQVYSFGACGAPASAWMEKTNPLCGGAFRLNDGKVKMRAHDAWFTTPLPDLMKSYRPDLVVVVSGDTMADYKKTALPKPWIGQQVATLTKGIQASGVSCVWIGPAWGMEGGKSGKTYAAVKEMSSYLSEIVAPCRYVDSLKMSKPGEWKTFDGIHFTDEGYQAWGEAITQEIVSPEILEKIKH